MSTETALREWRYGSTQAERLVAGILRLEKYTNIHPQAPLGGGDDGADILCERGRYNWVCAVYFPPTNKEFREIKDKFLHDITNANVHKRNGFVFMTNQRLTRGERNDLRDTAMERGKECEIYDVERIRGALDSPEGYGLRVSYLHIPMDATEQIAFFATRENQLIDLISEQSQHLRDVLQHIDRIREGQAHAFETVRTLAEAQGLSVGSPRFFDPLAIGEVNSGGGASVVSGNLTPDFIRLVHRLVCFDLPSRIIGHFRAEDVMIMKASAAPGEPTITPPAPAEIPRLLEDLCAAWHVAITSAKTPADRLEAIARFFYGLLFTHPFLDGNGRVARSILMEQCLESFGHVDMSRFDRGVDYYSALQDADRGEFEPLKSLIIKAISA